MGWYIYYGAIYLGIMLVYHFTKNVKRNPTFGVRFKATLADEEVWEATQKRAADIMYVVCPVFFAVNVIFYIAGLPVAYAITLVLCFLVVIFAETAYLYFYSKNLLEEKKKKGIKIEEKEFEMPNWIATLMFVISVYLAVSGIALCFIKPNPLMGVRISRTFQSIEIWRETNTFYGIGLFLISVTFAYLFSKHLKGIKDQKLFRKDIYYYIGSVLIWSFVAVIYAYLI